MSQSLENIGNVPDLMPIMFPSDDPFAYPTQPMSTLEDGHFRQDGTAQPLPFAFAPPSQQPAMPTTQPTDPTGTTMGMPNATYDNFSNFPVFSNGLSSMGAGVPNHFQHRRQISQSQHQSPVSHSPARTTGELVSSPDLVFIPNQNFAWQNYNFQPQHVPDPSQQQLLAFNGSQNFDMNVDDMSLDLGIPLDDILGNDACRPSGGFTNDDWIEWMNAGV